eukprot:m.47840 g.47840  ORF g.47840 m.47840 type:complete len:345 (-) comp10799_c0_seq1:122-1156(-)
MVTVLVTLLFGLVVIALSTVETNAQNEFSTKSLLLSVSCYGLSFRSDADEDAAVAKADVENALKGCKKPKVRSITGASVVSATKMLFDFRTVKHAKLFNKCVKRSTQKGMLLSSGKCSIFSSSIRENGCDYTSSGTDATTTYELDVDMNNYRAGHLADLPLTKFLKVMNVFGDAVMEACSSEIANGDKCKVNIWNKGAAVVTGPDSFSFQAIAGLDDCLQTIDLTKWFTIYQPTLPPNALGWELGTTGQSCDDVCAAVSGECVPASHAAIDTEAEVLFVADLLGLTCSDTTTSLASSLSPSYPFAQGTCSTLGTVYAGTDCSKQTTTDNNFCCCGLNCPTASAA